MYVLSVYLYLCRCLIDIAFAEGLIEALPQQQTEKKMLFGI
jgi:hypothetical protein